jgi:hypothetical protein
MLIASCGQPGKHAPRLSQYLSEISRAFPSTILSAPSAQAVTQIPHPSHFSSSILTILRFIFVPVLSIVILPFYLVGFLNF